MLLMGDEMGRTQRGNNNAYCQDNELGWMDWSLKEQNAELFRFSQALIALRQAASLENFLLRAKDVPAALDQLERWNATPGHPLAGRLDGKRIGMAGHSFGAVTTQAVSGQVALGGAVSWTDPRIRAAIALSPSLPRRGDPEGDLVTGFGEAPAEGTADRAGAENRGFHALPFVRRDSVPKQYRRRPGL